MTSFAAQKKQVEKLNLRHTKYWIREFGGRNFDYISNPKNFVSRIYFHQANDEDDKNSILKYGFNERFLARENTGLGIGLYMGRDKTALINFYSEDFNNPRDHIIEIRGSFDFFDLPLHKRPKPNIREFAVSKGYDGVRYYDPDATGEEFVLYRYDKIQALL